MEAKFLRHGLRHVENASGNIGAPIIEADHRLAAVLEISDSHAAGQRQRLVRSRATPAPEILTESGLTRKDEPAFLVVRSKSLFHVAGSLVGLHGNIMD